MNCRLVVKNIMKSMLIAVSAIGAVLAGLILYSGRRSKKLADGNRELKELELSADKNAPESMRHKFSMG
jgi:uncharacterized membrane protein affecting hemolysin expression